MSPWSPSTPSSSLLVDSDPDSRLLSQSLPSPESFDVSSHIHTGPGGADLSLSELSLSDKPYSRDGPRFSLLAPPPAPVRIYSIDQSAITEDDKYEEEGDVGPDDEASVNDTVIGRVAAEKAREERLQRDLFIIKQLNASFAVLNDALRATKSATEQVAEQLSQTDVLLDKYADILAKSESVTRLIFDERWEGADADEELLIKEREEALERARLEREQEAARREAEERARREADEAAQREAEERVKRETAAAAAVAKAPARGRGTGVVSSGVRGVRGTRATATAMAARGGRGTAKTAPVSTSTIPRARSVSATGSVGGAGGGIRPSSSTGRGSGLPRGVPRRG
ncbi:hypothetical protein PAXRUDRAFT_828820 [Paxillus rubicundulus Ve08.2h10]|uniref:DASH complex subunit DUO1 n=1 Tax=Paxillus rubicundulus Ve08.2h10 TaxID=930991 RepID=A0A0D0DVL0_9AGAM|nr:hypothetical protein PAXRUDRAFT_828820 [Paxillus rubicundulus Ve08.2h10]